MTPRTSRLIYFAAAIAVCTIAATLLLRDVRTFTLDDIAHAWRSIPRSKVGMSLLLTAASFSALGGYDILATRTLFPGRVHARLACLAGAAGNAISNTLGFHAVTGSLVRYHLYRQAGLKVKEVAALVAFTWSALGLGFVTVFALALLARHSSLFESFAGASLLVALMALLVWLGRRGRQFSVARLSLALPSSRIAALQLAIGAVEMSAAIGALYILMPAMSGSFAGFAAAYIAAVLLGIVSHAPGGLGVFEAAMLSFTSGQDEAGILAALLLYRLIYNLLPFGLAALALGGFELAHRRQLDGG
jgi:uncharacterized membrane protein YbhN (UPF0104 family)